MTQGAPALVSPLRIERRDWLAGALLVALWALFFWRMLTPNPADQLSLAEGDFSGQFYAFGAYQARRLLAGEIPLWNPYANGGHPFLADTQAAVFYPPRLLTISVSGLFGGWSYAALQLEAAVHYLLASLLMYAFVRRATGRTFAGLAAALTFAYGGYLTGYPMLQLAVLETATWLPLVLLAIFQATHGARIRRAWAALAGVGLGLCLLAGHPQTALFTLYVSLAYLGHRLWIKTRQAETETHPYRRFVADFARAAGALGAVGFGLAAIQVLPGWEYLGRTTRLGFTFDAKAGGFPFYDLAQFLVSDLVSHWSPLYVGLAGLALAVLALWRRHPGAGFWGVAALTGLIYSFGGYTVVYHLAYNLLPGASLFRGQERAAVVVAVSLSILTGLGASALADWTPTDRAFARRFVRTLIGGGALIFALAAALFVLWLGPEGQGYQPSLAATARAALLAALTMGAFAWRFNTETVSRWQIACIALVVFDLFSVNIGRNFEAVPAGERPRLSSLVDVALADTDRPFRVDGREGLGENYGALVGLQDIYGTSPLRLADHDALLNLPEPERWRLLGVRYVFSAREALPVESEIVAQDGDHYLHRLADDHPMAWLSAGSNDTGEPLANSSATIIVYEPERIVVEIDAPAEGHLIVSEHDYPGWNASLDGEPAPIERTAHGLRAVPASAGRHIVEMRYAPLSFALGAAISAATLGVVAGVAAWSWLQARRPRPGVVSAAASDQRGTRV